jgi:iron complex outermembrane receptor protein
MDDSQRDSLYLLKSKPENKSDSVYMRMDMPGRSTTLGTYFQVTMPWGDHNKLVVKGDNYTNNSIAEMTMHMRYAGFAPELPMYMQTWPEMLRNVTGVFIQNTTFVSQNMSIIVNGRVDYNIDVLKSKYGQEQFSVFNYSLDKTQSKLIKSLNMTFQYRFLESISMLATAGYAERMPTIGERMGFYLYSAYDGYDYIGNPYIKTEKSNFFSLAFLLSKPKLKVNFTQSFSFVNDYIMGVTDTQIPAMNFYAKGIRVYSNIPSAKLYSADLQVLYHPIRSVSVFLTSKFTYGELNSGNALPLIPPLKTVVAVQYQKDHFSLQAEGESSMAQNRINSEYGESKTPAFTVFNVKSGYSVPFAQTVVDIGFGITNLLNKAYYEHLDWGRINRPGRSVELFIRFSY